MKFSIIVASAMTRGAAAQACADVTVQDSGADAIQQCLDTSSCAWLLLTGQCVDSADARVAELPNCCVGSAESQCQMKSVENATDGVCRLSTTGRKVTSAPALDEIQHSLHLAGASYCTRENIESWSCGLHCDGASGFSVRRYFERADFWTGIFVGYVGYDSGMDAIVVSVRGTDNSQGIKNWVANLDFKKTYPYSQYPDAGVHEGFYKVWAGIKDVVLEGIQEVVAELGPKTVHITGHSMGGAVATDGALDLVLNHGLTVGAYTFGSPRAGDYPFAVAIDKHLSYHFRVTHNDDLVAHVPPENLGFYHPAWEVHFSERSGLDYKLCDGSGEDNSCANACSFYLTCTSIDDHLTYLDVPATCGSGRLTSNSTGVLV